MPNYKEAEVTGTQWTRAKTVIVNNNFNETPRILFAEETRLTMGASSIEIPGLNSSVGCNFDPVKTFDLLNPEDNSVIGSASHAEVQVILYSLYMALAAERDNPPVMPVV
jgi:hypothetical protein